MRLIYYWHYISQYINAAKELETIYLQSLNVPPACVFSLQISKLTLHNAGWLSTPHLAGMVTSPRAAHTCGFVALTTVLNIA